MHHFCFVILLCWIRWVFPQDIVFKKDSTTCNNCLEIDFCQEALRNIKTSPPTLCGWSGRTPKVCCQKPEDLLANFNTCALSTPSMDLPAIDFRDRGSRQSPTKTGAVIPKLIAQEISPWMVKLVAKGTRKPQDGFFCNANLIGPQHLLASAHCFDGRNMDTQHFEILTGNHTLYDIDNIIIHPNYSRRLLFNDIAVLRLKEKITFGSDVSPICLSPSLISNGTQHSVVRLNNNTKILEKTPAIIVLCNVTTSRISRVASEYPNGIINDFICVDRKSEDACKSDWDGIVVASDDINHRWMLMGIETGRNNCEIASMPVVYTRITTYWDWIITNLN